MPLEYFIVPEHRLVYVHSNAIVTAEDFKHNLCALAKDQEYIPPMRKLVDLRAAEGVKITPCANLDFVFFANVVADFFRHEQCALILNSGKSTEAVDTFQMRLDTVIDFKAFQDFAEAARWLQLDIKEEDLLARIVQHER